MIMEEKTAAVERKLLRELACSDYLAGEILRLEGAALVMEIAQNKSVCELIIEVRLPGWTNWPVEETPHDKGLLWIYLQNISDEKLAIQMPRHLLTGGLRLPWKVGMEFMANLNLGSWGEVLSWKTPLNGNEGPELLSAEVASVVSKCKAIVADNQPIKNGDE
jgi:hypothetical protein